jgi:serine O-acetyltransferase
VAGTARTARPADPLAGDESLGPDAFLAQLARERAAYALPPRLNALAEAVAHRALELLFPQFAAETDHHEGGVRGDARALRELLAQALEGRTAPGARSTADVVDRFFASLPAVHAALVDDARAIVDSDPASTSYDEVVLAYPGFRATAVYRLAHVLHLSGITLFSRLLTEVAHRETGIDIHPAARIGPRLAIDHGTGIVIGATAEIGARVRLYQGVTLGALSVRKAEARTKRHPTIGDDVIVYANATILGGQTVVGRGSRIGGNVWLTRSVAPLSVVLPKACVERAANQPAPDDPGLEYHL